MTKEEFLTQEIIDRLQSEADDDNGIIPEESILKLLQEYAEAYAKEVNQEQPTEEIKNDPLICKTCKSPARDWPDLGRRTCGCGRLGYNVPK